MKKSLIAAVAVLSVLVCAVFNAGCSDFYSILTGGGWTGQQRLHLPAELGVATYNFTANGSGLVADGVILEYFRVRRDASGGDEVLTFIFIPQLVAYCEPGHQPSLPLRGHVEPHGGSFSGNDELSNPQWVIGVTGDVGMATAGSDDSIPFNNFELGLSAISMDYGLFVIEEGYDVSGNFDFWTLTVPAEKFDGLTDSWGNDQHIGAKVLIYPPGTQWNEASIENSVFYGVPGGVAHAAFDL